MSERTSLETAAFFNLKENFIYDKKGNPVLTDISCDGNQLFLESKDGGEKTILGRFSDKSPHRIFFADPKSKEKSWALLSAITESHKTWQQSLEEKAKAAIEGKRKPKRKTLYDQNIELLDEIVSDVKKSRQAIASLDAIWAIARALPYARPRVGILVEAVRGTIMRGPLLDNVEDTVVAAVRDFRSNMRKALETVHERVQNKTKNQIGELRPANQKAIEKFDTQIADFIDRLPPGVTWNSQEVREILAWLDKRQFVLSIREPLYKQTLKEGEKQGILTEKSHPKDADALNNLFDIFQFNNDPDFTGKREQILVVIAGHGGGGKDHLQKALSGLSDPDGEYTHTFSPNFEKIQDLIKLPKGSEDDNLGDGGRDYRLYWEKSTEEMVGTKVVLMIMDEMRNFVLPEGEAMLFGRKNDDPLLKYLTDRDVTTLNLELFGIKIEVPNLARTFITTNDEVIKRLREHFKEQSREAFRRRITTFIEADVLSQQQVMSIYGNALQNGLARFSDEGVGTRLMISLSVQRLGRLCVNGLFSLLLKMRKYCRHA